MKRRACISIMTLSLLIAATAASAHAQSANRLVADVPFAFEVNGKTLPAGEYSVSQPMTASLLIAQTDGDRSAMVISREAEGQDKSKGARLVFHKYGDQYFLASVWKSASEGQAILQTGRERRLRRELATNGKAQPEVVAVLLKTR